MSTIPDTHLRADAQRNREAVLSAAIGLLSQQPDASMQEVAEASGLGRTTVYRHFPARDDLVRAIFARVGEEARRRIAVAIAEGGSAADVLRRTGAIVTGLAQEYRFLESFGHLAETVDGPAGTVDPLLEWMRSAHAQGALRPQTPPEWQHRMLRAMAVGAGEAVVLGRASAEDAGRLLGETLVQAFVAG